jgi:hypothetical protein
MTAAPAQYRFWGSDKTAGKSRRGEPCVMIPQPEGAWTSYVVVQFEDGATALVLRCNVRQMKGES